VTAFLLDSHTAYWYFDDPKNLSKTAAGLLANEEIDIFVSPVSAYELRFKAGQGRLKPLPADFGELAAAAGIDELPLSIAAAELAARLPLTHRDPWDRMLAAQSILRRCALISKDSFISKLGVQTIW
jgi:PIN domain nuclease of toxin-antitoxin system